MLIHGIAINWNHTSLTHTLSCAHTHVFKKDLALFSPHLLLYHQCNMPLKLMALTVLTCETTLHSANQPAAHPLQ